MKIGALRQTQLPVSSTGCGRCVCPCSASPASAAGSGSAAQPSTPPCFVHRTRSLCLPLALSRFLRRGTAPACKNRSAAPAPPRLFLPQAAARLCSQQQLPVSSTGRGRCVCLLRLADFCGAPRRALAKTGALRQARLAASSAGRASACLPRCFCRRQRSAQLPPACGRAPAGALNRKRLLLLAGCAYLRVSAK